MPVEIIPPLMAGERLSRAEFERRYEAMPNLKRAELIEGIVYLPTAEGTYRQGCARSYLVSWLGRYEIYTPGLVGGAHSTIRLDLKNEPQPCATVMIEPSLGGQADIDADDFIAGAPELIVEVTDTQANYDLHEKRGVYCRHGVCEYIVWRVLDKVIDWFVLRKGQYERLEPDAAGILKSEVFPGLWLDPNAMVGDNLPRVMDVVQNGLNSPEHAAFVTQLNPPLSDQ